MKNASKIIASLFLTVGILAGCSAPANNTTTAGTSAGEITTTAGTTSTDTTETGTTGETTGQGGKIAMVTDLGGVNDNSFNESAWNGMEELKAEGYEVSFVESAKDADYAPNLSLKTDEGNDLIWGIGFLMKGAVEEAALDNPDQLMGIIDDSFEDGELPNVTSVMFRAEESSFLVGYIASYMTKTDHVGFVLGMGGPTMDRFQYGYMAGVHHGAREQGKEVKVDAVTIESFNDTAKSKATANKMFSDGADIVFHAAGDAGKGVIEAAKDMGKFAIGVDLDQNALAPDNVMTSSLKNVNVAIRDLSKRILNGEKLGGTTVYYGLKEGGVGIAESSSKHVPQEILDKTKEIENKIIAGEITVPISMDEYDAFIAE